MGNFELRTDVGPGFGLVTFVDTGNVWGKIQDINPEQLKFTTGLGLRYKTPVGPLSIDYGVKLSRRRRGKALVQYISASVRHFRRQRAMGNGQIAKEHYSQFPVFSCVCLLCFVFCLLSSSYFIMEIIERVVAYVNNNAITLSEFQKNAQKTRKRLGNVSDSEIINAMIK